ncbi:MAG TPA: glycosyltransferase family 2 protein [Acidimicrobiia bacterium]|nr:glycosyltransferase family 2 protein [Acidimicrobiia bacterium]
MQQPSSTMPAPEPVSTLPTPTPPRTTGPIERGLLYFVLAAVIVAICAYKSMSVRDITRAPAWVIYSLVVLVYILSRFVLGAMYHPKLPRGMGDADLPVMAIVVPAYNEERDIQATLHACVSVDYPADKLRVVVVDDCSTDGTLRAIREFERGHPELVVLPQAVNQGKRAAMAVGVRWARDADVFVFIDSDSQIEPSALRKLARYFADPRVGAVAGHTDVANRDVNFLTRMQAVRYYVAFRVYKSAEALFSSVTCCSGCFSGYRREAVDRVLDKWLNQTFLGEPSTYGDDRSLTNFLLRDWRVLYAPDAHAYTVVPETMKKFLRQQMRWKKSWIRESIRACTFMWRKHPIVSSSFYLGIFLPLIAPQIVLKSLVFDPYVQGTLPYWYVGGILAMALLYGLYYRVYRRERLWYHGVLFALFYTAVLVWQFPLALATMRDSKWGTR